MPRGDKDKYTDKQKRKAEHIEEGYKERGLSADEAERRAWATVNAMHDGRSLVAAVMVNLKTRSRPERAVAKAGATDGFSWQ